LDPSLVFIELGAAVAGLALLGWVANRFGVSTVPLYLLGGLAFGNGGLVPLRFSESFVHVGAETGVVLLLFMLGLEYTGEQLGANLRAALPSGLADLALNATPGLVAGLLWGWRPVDALLLGGVTYISSSGIAAKLLTELGWESNPETPTILSILVLEDLVMAVFLPFVAVLLIGQSPLAGLLSELIAVSTVAVILFVALRCGAAISRVLSYGSDEVVLLSTFGMVLLVSGVAQRLRVSAAVGAFLVGIALSGPVTTRVRRLIGPLRDLFAALFFLFFGLEIDPSALPPVLGAALALGVLTALTKLLTGWWAAGRVGVDAAGRLRAGVALVPRGEFSIVIAGLGVAAGSGPKLGPVSAAYVLLLAVLGPILSRIVEKRLTPRETSRTTS
jgi:CPA2 family monovalent cation:H+ antiporter-2